LFAYVNNARIHSWNQPVLSNEGKVSCSTKYWESLLGLKLTTDRHPQTMSQTRYQLHFFVHKYKKLVVMLIQSQPNNRESYTCIIFNI